jgi:hemerythrin
VLYPQLRAADRDLTATIDRLDHEHRVIHEVLERIDRTLVEFARDREHLDTLVGQVRHLRSMLESHFAYEEDAIGLALGVHRIGV